MRSAEEQIISGASATWASSLSSAASVDWDGLVTAQRNGKANIYARAGDASASVQVVVGQRSWSTSVLTEDGQIGMGGAPTFHPLGREIRDARGHGIAGKSIAISVPEGGGRLDPSVPMADDGGISMSEGTLCPSGTLLRAMATGERHSAIFQAQAVEVDPSDIVCVSITTASRVWTP